MMDDSKNDDSWTMDKNSGSKYEHRHIYIYTYTIVSHSEKA